MNKFSRTDRARILGLMVEGMSIRAISRVTSASKNTIVKLLEDAGEAFSEYQDRTMRGLACRRIQVDEIWAFVYPKAKNVATARAAPEEAGDIWTWMAIDTDTKLIPSFYVGTRDAAAMQHFISDLAGRLVDRVQLISVRHKPDLAADEEAFGGGIDYATLIKYYGESVGSLGRYSPGACTGTDLRRGEGRPDLAHFSTSCVERPKPTTRMDDRRFTCLTNALSKKAENHVNSIAIHTMHYNFVPIHQTLRCTPAMAANVSQTLWGLEDMVKVLEDWENNQRKKSN